MTQKERDMAAAIALLCREFSDLLNLVATHGDVELGEKVKAHIAGMITRARDTGLTVTLPN